MGYTARMGSQEGSRRCREYAEHIAQRVTISGLPGMPRAVAVHSSYSTHIAGHDEQRLVPELIVDRSKPLHVIVFRHIDVLFCSRHDADVDGIVMSLVDADELAEFLPQQEVEGEVAEGHGDDGIERVGIAGAHEITEALIDDIDAPPAVEAR